MSEEEKKAIDNMKSLLLYSEEHEYFSPFMEQEIVDMNIVLNIVEKQQKEIEKLNFENHMVKKWNEQLDKNCINKDKIREKLDKYRKKLEQLHSQELWNEPEDSIKDFKYNHYLEAYKELLEE